MGRFLYGLVVLFAAVFLVLLIFFRITSGSFEDAGARMDRLLGAAADETEQATEEFVRDTDRALEEYDDDE